MTDLQTWHEPPTQAVAIQDATTRAVQRLGEWATSADAAYTVAQRLVQTAFVPDSFRGKPSDATAAILAGLEIGLSPMAALRSFDVIQGQAAPRAITLRAILQSQGHETVIDESSGTRCKMRGRRRGSQEWQSVTWTLDRAKQLGLTNKPNWKSQPQNMLVARATSELARLIAADAILGVAYTSEELEDGNGPAPAAPPVETAPRRMSRRQPEPEPAPETPEPQPEPTEPTPDTITQAQSRKMHALFNEQGITDRDDRLAWVAGVIGHQVDSSSDLTKAEAGQVIDALESGGLPLPEGGDH